MGKRPRPAGWRLWSMRIAAAVLFPLLLLAAVEAGLRVFGYGFATSLS